MTTLANDDWIKSGTWDLWAGDRDGKPVLITNIRHLTGSLRSINSHLETDRLRLEAFLRLPAARVMPNRFTREVDRFLALGEPNLV